MGSMPIACTWPASRQAGRWRRCSPARIRTCTPRSACTPGCRSGWQAMCLRRSRPCARADADVGRQPPVAEPCPRSFSTGTAIRPYIPATARAWSNRAWATAARWRTPSPVPSAGTGRAGAAQRARCTAPPMAASLPSTGSCTAPGMHGRVAMSRAAIPIHRAPMPPCRCCGSSPDAGAAADRTSAARRIPLASGMRWRWRSRVLTPPCMSPDTVSVPAPDGPYMRKPPQNPYDLGRLDLDDILGTIDDEVRQRFGEGKVADYIPSLADVPPDRFGMALALLDGGIREVGHSRERFSIQSVSKVYTLTLALEAIGDRLWKRVDREPSGDPFNSLIQLEHEKGIPRNPFMNAGALISADVILSNHKDAEA